MKGNRLETATEFAQGHDNEQRQAQAEGINVQARGSDAHWNASLPREGAVWNGGDDVVRTRVSQKSGQHKQRCSALRKDFRGRNRRAERNGTGANSRGPHIRQPIMRQAMRANTRLWARTVGDESDGGESYIRELRANLEPSGVAERFVLPAAPKTWRNTRRRWTSSHASISPQRFGMVAPEAIAAGWAVVSADDGGPREADRPGNRRTPRSAGPRRSAGRGCVQKTPPPKSLPKFSGGAARASSAQPQCLVNTEGRSPAILEQR
jgi:hypothetical protein